MKDIILGSISLALSVFVYVASAAFSRPEEGLASNPAFYPQILALIMGAMSLFVLIKAIIDKPKFGFHPNWEYITNISKVLAILIVYVLSLNILGFIASTLVYIFAGIIIFGGNIKTALICSVPITVAIYVIFSILFKMILPAGILFS